MISKDGYRFTPDIGMGHHVSGKWHILELGTGKVLAEYDTMEDAAQHIDRMYEGKENWVFDTLQDDGGGNTEILEARQREARGEKFN
jgi:hypothetical protein